MTAGGMLRELPQLRDRERVFRDRRHAGETLAAMMEMADAEEGIVLALPAGGVPVAAVVAERLGLPLDVAVVSKVLVPWNTEAGYGAVAFDGTVRINDELVARLGLSGDVVARGVEETRVKVQRRVHLFRGDRPFPDLAGRRVIVVDDGLASGFTMLVALQAVGKRDPEEIVVAVPTGHPGALERIAPDADRICCANVRSGFSFAVASAYRSWSDVSEEEALRFLR